MIDAARSAGEAAIEQVVESSYGRLVAYLASVSGDIAAAEDALSDAFLAAIRTWPQRGVPHRPDSWLVTVARRSLIDAARRRETAARALPEIARFNEEPGQLDLGDPDTVPDKRLELLFACAHPAVDPSMRSPLMLQAVLGLDAARIASAFLVSPSTMGQRLVRVKTKVRQARIPFTLPALNEIPERAGSVLDAIYVAYGTGWDDGDGPGRATGADQWNGLYPEAIKLATVLTDLLPDNAEAHGLLAMMLHSGARADARRSRDGEFVPLDQQDVTLWSRARMRAAEEHLAVALGLGQMGPYQLMGAIQSVHNLRAVTGQTDWAAIAELYDGLVAMTPTIGAYVARAKATSHTNGPAAALAQLDELPAARVSSYQPYWVVRAYCLREAGDRVAAAAAASQAIGLTSDPPTKRHLYREYLA
ncbi:MAG: RNA polymerase subunit sigma-70 [Chloroflexota bacterium]|nr:RNA polymerase subunit sigma-70 [Chloroflexota bacterium]